ncbi:MAG: helix-turn-helix domain-containing protein [Phycisphaerae bacterium]|nr:helix-turn-helix domain-containing protein [Phycisphaerae bacterium]
MSDSNLKGYNILFPAEVIDAIADAVAARILGEINSAHKESPDILLTVEEAAALLNKSAGQIYQWVNKTQHGLLDFPFLKAGRSLRFSKNELIEWMKNNSKRLENRKKLSAIS